MDIDWAEDTRTAQRQTAAMCASLGNVYHDHIADLERVLRDVQHARKQLSDLTESISYVDLSHEAGTLHDVMLEIRASIHEATRRAGDE